MKRREILLSDFELIKKILDFAKPFNNPLLWIMMLTLIGAVISGLSGYAISKAINFMHLHGADKVYIKETFGLIILAGAFTWLHAWISGKQNVISTKKVEVAIQNYLNHQSILKFFQFSNGQHINEHSGVKQNIVNNGVASIQNQIVSLSGQVFQTLGLFIVSIGILIYAHWLVGLIYVFGSLIFCFMLYKHNKKTIPGIRAMREQKQANARMLSEMFRFITLVKNENQEERSLEEVRMAQQKHQDIYEETWLPGIKRIQRIRFFSRTMNTATLITALYLFYNNNMQIGNVVLVLMYGSNFVDSLWQIMGIHKSYTMDKINIERYFELLEIKPEITLVENPIHPEKFFGEIEFKNISFHYPKRDKKHSEELEEIIEDEEADPILRNVSFSIKQGEKIGIVGESGSGKSTIAGLLRRNFDPQEGQIKIDGNDLRLIDLPWFLQNIGSVDQSVELFDRSIRENILFGLNGKAKNFTDEKLHELAKMTRIDAFFERLEHGFDTLVGEKGIKLSGGERQRVGIARALAKDPAILIFDEATSALDSLSEKIVQESIDEASKGKTAIIIAHRLSTVKNCDRILIFRNGVLLSEGTHEELLKSSEYYAELVAHQMMS